MIKATSGAITASGTRWLGGVLSGKSSWRPAELHTSPERSPGAA